MKPKKQRIEVGLEVVVTCFYIKNTCVNIFFVLITARAIIQNPHYLFNVIHSHHLGGEINIIE